MNSRRDCRRWMNLIVVPDADAMCRSDEDDPWLVGERELDRLRNADLRASLRDVSTLSAEVSVLHILLRW